VTPKKEIIKNRGKRKRIKEEKRKKRWVSSKYFG